MSRYGIKEVFDTLQGEGMRTGARSVFVRFSGCNLWSGNPAHREQGEGACAKWCDTDFYKGKVHSTEELLARMDSAWPVEQAVCGQRWCVLSGGEPCLQLDVGLVDALHAAGWLIAVETNGTVACPALAKVDHVTLSPKKSRTVPVVLERCTELKIVLPGVSPNDMADAWTDEELASIAGKVAHERAYVQPQDPILDPALVEVTLLKSDAKEEEQYAAMLYGFNLKRCLDFITGHSDWRLSVQVHKYILLP